MELQCIEQRVGNNSGLSTNYNTQIKAGSSDSEFENVGIFYEVSKDSVINADTAYTYKDFFRCDSTEKYRRCYIFVEYYKLSSELIFNYTGNEKIAYFNFTDADAAKLKKM